MAFKKGCIPWNKGKRGRANSGSFKRGHTPSLESRKKMSIARKGNPKKGDFEKGHIPWIKGRKHSAETRLKISLAHKGKHHKGTFKKGHAPVVTEESRRKMSEGRRLKNNSNWRGGKSFEPYGLEFNNKIREKIRKRDDHTCQECGKHQNNLDRKLAIHHIDYDKQNNKIENLISLCESCHSKTNFNRIDWTKYFEDKLRRCTI